MPGTQNPAQGDPGAAQRTDDQQAGNGGGGDGGDTATGSSQQQQPNGRGNGTDGGEPLGQAGLEALRTERSARETAERALATAQRELQNATNAQERAVAEARVQARQEVLAESNATLIRAEVIAAAVGKLRNPRLAPNLISLDGLEVKDGKVDAKEIDKRLDKLLEEEGYLAAANRPRPGSGDGGSRGAPVAESMDARIRRAAGRSGG